MKPLKNESAFQAYFRRNLSQFGYEKALTDYQGTRQKAFPDYWCVVEGWQQAARQLVRVEIELLAYNFVLHEHDPDLCDLVIVAEDNLELYGLKSLGVPLVSANLPCKPTYGRCRAVAERIYKAWPSGGKLADRSLASTLAWWHEPLDCFVCEQPFRDIGRAGNVQWSSEVQWHQTCLDSAVVRLGEYLCL